MSKGCIGGLWLSLSKLGKSGHMSYPLFDLAFDVFCSKGFAANNSSKMTSPFHSDVDARSFKDFLRSGQMVFLHNQPAL